MGRNYFSHLSNLSPCFWNLDKANLGKQGTSGAIASCAFLFFRTAIFNLPGTTGSMLPLAVASFFALVFYSIKPTHRMQYYWAFKQASEVSW